MFGLPLKTTLMVFGFPCFWLIYTAVFLMITRNWKDNPQNRKGGSV